VGGGGAFYVCDTEKNGKLGMVLAIAQHFGMKAWLKLNCLIIYIKRAWAKLSHLLKFLK
jgi:hypothetical protein